MFINSSWRSKASYFKYNLLKQVRPFTYKFKDIDQKWQEKWRNNPAN